MTRGRVTSDLTSRISSNASNRVSIQALRHINLVVEHGTRLGLIGLNGAGKSTLLHVMAGIYVPERGAVTVEGKVACMLGGSLGVDPELTGRENIELRGLYLGLSRADIRERLDDIIEFTQLGPFIDMPFRTYSAGMRARLEFAISTSIHADIVLMDEGIGTGDASFIAQANQRLENLASEAGIVVVASHSESLLRKICTHGALLEAGTINLTGDIETVLERYMVSLTPERNEH
jgi:ABC-2 type transport system ATP-binding protein/lipopolysaccharide transport system ATP-binding protein